MHIRSLTRQTPAPAFNVEQILFVVNGLIGVINSVFQTGNTALVFLQNAGGLLKPSE
jgi:hypothetical protein